MRALKHSRRDRRRMAAATRLTNHRHARSPREERTACGTLRESVARGVALRSQCFLSHGDATRVVAQEV
jgi:hypothetical protein